MTKKDNQQDNKQGLHSVVLLKDHKHEGVMKRASDTITVTTADRNWLLAQHVIAPDNAPAVAE